MPDPAADYPAALVGLGATIVTDRRQIAADDFFVDLFETALEEGELVTSVVFPEPRRAAYMKFPNPASRYAIVGVFVAWTASGMRVAVTGGRRQRLPGRRHGGGPLPATSPPMPLPISGSPKTASTATSTPHPTTAPTSSR